ncbi:hypothetical protein CEXT_349031 [Caerostris extrusa]|uniref:Lipocalin n=1 Tax=Caerostris extrusa TaxID=172846 RepID=A0AAV4QJJ6_CAEEX|nr:hypothetical protein CEXT_349031 [Caerostris extrusa]
MHLRYAGQNFLMAGQLDSDLNKRCRTFLASIKNRHHKIWSDFPIFEEKGGDYDIVIGWYADDPEMTNMKYVDGMDLTQKSFCEADNKTRIGCETRLPEATCQRFQEVTKCAGILYQEMELNGKCGVDVL